ncbi:hypothetical protein BH24CHL6_BH24CHL6_07580 [soil metagenome]
MAAVRSSRQFGGRVLRATALATISSLLVTATAFAGTGRVPWPC